MNLNDLLKMLVEKSGSDLHIKVGSPPIIRIDGMLTHVGKERLTAEAINQMILNILDDRQKKEFSNHHELDFAYGVPGVARFRVNLSVQRGTVRSVMRIVPFDVKNFTELNLPEKALTYLCNLNHGLVLVTGPTGSGKSTTLAAMINYINNNRNAHVVTIEDPIEFLHRDNKCIISQREVGSDTESFSNALRHVLRQDPDVILIGEMRDLETISTALTAAETGHLVLSTLHTTDAPQTIDRIIDVFPPHQQQQVRIQLASCLNGILSQKILPFKTGAGRIPATEVLIATPLIRKMVLETATHMEYYRQILAAPEFLNMHTLNQDLVRLYREDRITMDVALTSSNNPDEFRLNLRGIYSGGTSDTMDQRKGAAPSQFEGRYKTT
ncbi:MAG: type IV pilus twitching motility protein PilT [bacterium]